MKQPLLQIRSSGWSIYIKYRRLPFIEYPLWRAHDKHRPDKSSSHNLNTLILWVDCTHKYIMVSSFFTSVLSNRQLQCCFIWPLARCRWSAQLKQTGRRIWLFPSHQGSCGTSWSLPCSRCSPVFCTWYRLLPPNTQWGESPVKPIHSWFSLLHGMVYSFYVGH